MASIDLFVMSKIGNPTERVVRWDDWLCIAVGLFRQLVHLHPIYYHLDGIVFGVGSFHPSGTNLHVNEQEVGCAEYVHYLRFAPC